MVIRPVDPRKQNDLSLSTESLLKFLQSSSLIPPRGYSIAGVSGSCAAWIDGFSLIITR